MDNNNTQTKDGFTIIEVMLVLAIAGLIFLMIFIAWPALSRTQRDSQRRDDISVLLKKVKDYQTNNRGALPTGEGEGVYGDEKVTDTSWSGFYRDYLGSDFIDPGGTPYKLMVVKCDGTGTVGSPCEEGRGLSDNAKFDGGGEIRIVLQATCDGESVVVTNNPRRIAAQYKLEGGGIYCANS